VSEAARRALACLDLTNLAEGCTAADIAALCARAVTPFGRVAAVCIWPRFVAVAKAHLAGTGVRVATVVNFPSGGLGLRAVRAEVAGALADGADEIDLVMPYRRLMAGDARPARRMVAAVRAAAPGTLLKVILETGELGAEAMIRRAASVALAGGADFLKTSTGKVGTNATPAATRLLLEAARGAGRPVGVKPAGGVRTTADAEAYLALADGVMGPGWARPATFRFGASGLLDALLATLSGGSAAAGQGY
jgi:deoxyribose-phosphate aldolase